MFIANFSATMVTSLPSFSLSLSLYLSLSLSLSLSHRKYLTHNIGSASALPIIGSASALPIIVLVPRVETLASCPRLLVRHTSPDSVVFVATSAEEVELFRVVREGHPLAESICWTSPIVMQPVEKRPFGPMEKCMCFYGNSPRTRK